MRSFEQQQNQIDRREKMKALITATMITTLSFGGVALADQYEEYERHGLFGGLTEHSNPALAGTIDTMQDLPATAAGKPMRVEEERGSGFNLNGPFDKHMQD
jgi:hypothetical protein